MGNIKANCLQVGMIYTNCFIVFDDENKQAFITDPGGDAGKIERFIDGAGLSPEAILLTHAHFDHIGAVPELKSRYNIPVYVHELDEEMLNDCRLNMGSVRVDLDADDVRLKGGETINIAGIEIKVIHTPGHTKGGVCYYIEKAKLLLAGDTMFRFSWGRTDFYGGSEAEIMSSIREKLLPLPEDTTVLPGHDSATTIAIERRVHDYNA